MKKTLKRIVASMMAVAFVMPNGFMNSLAVHQQSFYSDVESREEASANWSITTTLGANLKVDGESRVKLNKERKTHTYKGVFEDVDSGSKLNEIKITCKEKDGEEIVLNASENKGSIKGVLTASINKFPEIGEKFDLTITADESIDETNYEVSIVGLPVSKEEYSVSVEKSNFSRYQFTVGSDVTNPNGMYYEASNVTVSIKPDSGYALRGFEIWYTVNGSSESRKITSSETYKDWSVSFSSTGETTIKGKINGDLEIKNVETEELPKEYKVRFDADDGIDVTRPGSSSITVKEGQSVSVRAVAKTGYLLGEFVVQSGKTYATWVTGQEYITVGNSRVDVREDGDTVSFTIPEIYEDMTIKFTSIYDEENIPIEIQEYSRIDIYSDVGETVPKGSDAIFYISTTSEDYIVSKITLKIGSQQKTVDADSGEISIDGKNYPIEDLGDGTYSLFVDNIKEPVKVSATSTRSTSSNVSRPRLTIGASSNLKITKSTNSSYIDAGDSVRFYFTPNKNYQISEITLKMGNSSKTVSASETSITVGNETYRMSRDSDGVVTLYLTDIRKNVTVSAKAYFSRDPVKPTSVIKLNKNSYSPFMRGYPDGTFRPQNMMTKAEAISMLYNVCEVSSVMNTPVFADVPQNSWSALYINTFANAGIIDKGTYFYPNNPITRGEMAEILYRLEGSPSVQTGSVYFSDINSTESTKAIRYAASKGWVNGYSDGTFRPYNYMTRAEVATMMCRVLDRKYGGSIYPRYSDVKQGYWAYNYIQLAS